MSRLSALYLLFTALCMFSCTGKRNQSSVPQDGVPVKLSYAKQFTITNAGEYTTLTVLNPWKPGAVYDTYYLVKNDEVQVPQDGQKIKIPLQTLMVNSATHLGFLDLLGELDKVTGVCNSDYIYNRAIKEGVKEGRIADLGDSFNLDIEKLLILHPQAVMTSGYNADDENSKRMKQTGLNILYNIEWQENTPLGRAEWIKYMGAFFDKSNMADSIFSVIESSYNDIKEQAGSVKEKPSVLSGQDFRGSWSMPGGKSFSARLLQDAGADYFYKNDSTTGSIANTIEEALIHFNDADVWIGAQPSTLAELGKANNQYKLFKAYKTGKVYNTNKRINASGGNDYWESGVARPDLILSDLIKILHPLLLPGYELTYYQKLEE